MTELIDLLRAKSRNNVENPEGRQYLLKEHIAETLQQLKRLYDYVEINSEYIEYGDLRDKEKRDELFKSLAKAVFLHDLGKIEYSFQKKVHADKKDAEEWGKLEKELNWNHKTKGIRHEMLSIIWSYFLLNKEGQEEGKIRTAVLLHHYNEFFTDAQKEFIEIISGYKLQTENYLDFLISERKSLEPLISALLTYVENKFKNSFIEEAVRQIRGTTSYDGVSTLRKAIMNKEDDIYIQFYEPNDNDENRNRSFLFMLGILRRCDYTGSAFIEIEKTLDMEEFYKTLKLGIEKEMSGKRHFWQKDVIDKGISKNAILVAPTGSGKSEFSLLWADKWKRKLIYTLPLRVALNDLYKRFYDYGSDKESISLFHSTSFIEYLKENGTATDISVDQKLSLSQHFSYPLMLTTPDQVFLTCLNFYGSDKLIGIYPISSVVIDEIQAYDPEMAAVIIKSIETIQKMNGNILIMTATYPPYFKKFFNGYSKGAVNIEKFESIDVDNYEHKNRIKNYSVKRHKIYLEEDSFFDGDTNNGESGHDGETQKRANRNLSESLKKYMEKMETEYKSSNVLIVCNVVSNAIRVYEALTDRFEGKHIFLLHSRLIEKEKRDRIEKIKDILNPSKNKGTIEKERVILVSTQMVEASVNVDFDVLITEISPIDSQIQRWGRIYRNRTDGNGEEIDYLEKSANIIIFIGRDKYTNRIYDKSVVEKTTETLKEEFASSEPVLAHEDERNLINKVFSKNVKTREDVKTLQTDYEEKIEKILSNLQYFSIEKRSDAQRVFRKIAGVQFVFPDLMTCDHSGDSDSLKLREGFSTIIKTIESGNMSWQDIIDKLRSQGVAIGVDEKKLRDDKHKLRQLLNDFSINLPAYYIEGNSENGNNLRRKEFKGFKGFYVLDIAKDKADEVMKKGIDITLSIDDYMPKDDTIIG